MAAASEITPRIPVHDNKYLACSRQPLVLMKNSPANKVATYAPGYAQINLNRMRKH